MDEEYKEFRPISALKNVNPIFQGSTATAATSANTHQLAFNYGQNSIFLLLIYFFILI